MASRLFSRLSVLGRVAGGVLAGSERRPSESPCRILVAHHLLLGDTLMLTPLLAKLRHRHPAAEILMVAPPACVPLYAGRPYGVDVLPYDPRRPVTLRALEARSGFDLAIVPGDNRYSWLARALGARWVIAFAGDRPAYKNWPVDRLVPYPDYPAAWGDMVAGLAEGDPPPPYRRDDWPDPPCTPFPLPERPYCVFHVGASSPLKLWGTDKWLELARELTQRGYQVVWSGGPGEEGLVAAIDGGGRYPSLAGKLDLPQVWRLVEGASLLVCPDTGVAHLGRLTGTPTVALFGPGSPVICGTGDFWRDSPYRAVTIEDMPCRNQQVLFRRRLGWVRRCGRTIRECGAPRCMEALGPAVVLEAVDSLL